MSRAEGSLAVGGALAAAFGPFPDGVGTVAAATGLLSGALVLLGTGPAAASRLSRCLGPAETPDRCRGRAPRTRVSPRRRAAAGTGAAGEPVPVPVVIDLVAAVVEAGVPPGAAIRLVARCLTEVGDPGGAVLLAGGAAAATWRPLFAALELAESCGLGPASLLRSAAGDQRRHRTEALAVAARRLAVLVVLPTTLCLLPAFLALTVVPLVLALLPMR
jgi:hypothetical protein